MTISKSLKRISSQNIINPGFIHSRESSDTTARNDLHKKKNIKEKEKNRTCQCGLSNLTSYHFLILSGKSSSKGQAAICADRLHQWDIFFFIINVVTVITMIITNIVISIITIIVIVIAIVIVVIIVSSVEANCV